MLMEVASVFFQSEAGTRPDAQRTRGAQPLPNVEARYRTLVEQIPAVIFMAYLDRGIGEAYVSPQIEVLLGFTQEEWLNDPVRWYRQIHSDDKSRWSVEAARMFLTGQPLRSAYRVMARDGRVIWFHCEAKMVRGEDGRPWFIHGVGFDITELKHKEQALQDAMVEQERLITKLENALNHVKTLHGLLPICAFCHKIRNTDGKWERLEAYISTRTEADFTHGFCPECAEKHYGVKRSPENPSPK